MLFNSLITPSIPVRALPTHLHHPINSSAWRRQGARTSPHQREANLANTPDVGWGIIRAKRITSHSAFYFSNQMVSWDVAAGTPTALHRGRHKEGTHLGWCCRIPFMKSFASSLKWTTSGMVHEISPFWIFRRVCLSFSPANGDLHVRLIYGTPWNERRQVSDFYFLCKWQKHKMLTWGFFNTWGLHAWDLQCSWGATRKWGNHKINCPYYGCFTHIPHLKVLEGSDGQRVIEGVFPRFIYLKYVMTPTALMREGTQM